MSEQLSTSGWSDALTRLHEQEAGSNLSIDRYSRACAVEAIRDHGKTSGAILELGSSSGFLLRDMRREFPAAAITGSDIIADGIMRLGAIDGVAVRALDITNNDLADNAYDVVVAINVLEHVEDDAKAACEVARILRPGGIFVVEVPAGPSLYDGYDACLMHYRRYTKASLRALLKGAGLALLEESAIGFVVYPAFWATKKLNRIRYGTEANEELVRRAIRNVGESSLLSASLAVEGHLRRLISLPFGIRQTAVAAKPLQ
jgi:SAM-dependent methyltransferase